MKNTVFRYVTDEQYGTWNFITARYVTQVYKSMTVIQPNMIQKLSHLQDHGGNLTILTTLSFIQILEREPKNCQLTNSFVGCLNHAYTKHWFYLQYPQPCFCLVGWLY